MSFPPRSRRSMLTAGGLVGVAALAGCVGFTGPSASTQSSQSVPLDGSDRLAVENGNGDVLVRPDDGLSDAVRLDVTKRVRGDADLFGDVAVETATGSGVLEISIVYETNRARQVSVDLAVAVPPALTVERASTANGDVEVRDVSGDARVETANGDAVARSVDGFVTVRSANGDAVATDCAGVDAAGTVNGEVDVELLATRGGVTLESANGDVNVGVPASLDAEVVLSTGNGDVTVDGLDPTVHRRTERRFEGTLGDGGDRIEARSGNGDVRLYALS